jgi:ubiquinone/menaquinone biosynthesis C-methylase UbiE
LKAPDDDGWGCYWAQGFLTSFAATFDGNYEGTIRTTWDRRFAALADGSRILDIGTGNGAIALLAAAAAQKLGRSYAIDALDLADVQPASDLRDASRALLHYIRFHPRTDASRSGFENDSFDLVTGNFALEYTDWPATVRELIRVTARDGEHMFVMHSSESVIAATAEQELRYIDLILNKTRLFERASELIDTVGALAEQAGPRGAAQSGRLSAGPAVEQCRGRLNEATRQLSDVIAQAAHPGILKTALGHVSQAYRSMQSSGRPAALAQLAQAQSAISANASRLSALCRVASARPDIEHLVELYRTHGYTDVCIDTLSQEPAGLLAWVLRVRPV